MAALGGILKHATKSTRFEIANETGVVDAGEDIVFVVVLAGHRRESFRAVEDGIDRLKDEVPIFKKETTVEEDFWVHDRDWSCDASCGNRYRHGVARSAWTTSSVPSATPSSTTATGSAASSPSEMNEAQIWTGSVRG